MATVTATSSVMTTHALACGAAHRPGPRAVAARPSSRRALVPASSGRVPRGTRGRFVPRASDDDGDGFLPNSLGTVGAALELRSRLQDVDLERREKRGGRDGDGWEEMEESWVRVPRGRAWGAVHFVGGAVLGSYPHIAYDAFLSRLCDDAGIAVVATPYELGTDHGAISEECQRKFARAWNKLRARENLPASAPVFAAGHSLGCKLQLLAACGGDDEGTEGSDTTEKGDTTLVYDSVARAGHLFIAFNNATAADSVRLLEKFARELLKRRAEQASGGDASMNAAFEGFTKNLPNLTALAERAASAAGLDFTPSPSETLERAKRGFDSPRVRLVKFDEDDLDQNEELEQTLRRRFETIKNARDASGAVSAVVLQGTHLSPVFFKFDGAGLSPAFAKLGGVKVGDEEQVERLARDSVAFLTGK